jgi:hypothetical protein
MSTCMFTFEIFLFPCQHGKISWHFEKIPCQHGAPFLDVHTQVFQPIFKYVSLTKEFENHSTQNL